MRTSFSTAARLGHTVGELPARKFRFVCQDCLSQRVATLAPSSQQRRGYAKKKPLTERLRSKIWGGDVPGPKDVYGQSQFFPSKQQPQETVAEDNEELQPQGRTFRAREALTVDQAKKEDADYEPAETWNNLERIGGPTGWWEKEWDKDNIFVAFRPSQRPTALKTAQLFSEVKRAYIEASAVQNVSSGNLDISQLPTYSYLPFHTLEPTMTDGGVAVVAVPAGWQEKIVRLAEAHEYTETGSSVPNSSSTDAAQLDSAAETSSSDSVPPSELVGATWRSLPLTNLDLKFALIKRIIQLTGARISDPDVGKIRTLGQLLEQLERKEPPKKTAAILNEKSQLVDMPNIHIYANRQTWVDREKHLGRYKVIARELEKQGLPLPKSKRRGRSM